MIKYKIEDRNGYPHSYGNSASEAAEKFQKWVQDYPWFNSYPCRIIRITETPMEELYKNGTRIPI